ncbi:MAG: hypothetical protein KTR24_00940 [Saprospiraceae bacterium]|nr:hypothetical protein [Saprospiraceae bacterium]
MKVAFTIISLTLGCFTLGLQASPVVDKEKTYSKSYPLNKGDRVEIFNQFGDVHVETWQKSSVQVDVSIEVSARNDERAQRLLDAIQIKDRSSGSRVTFRTEIGKASSNNSKNNGKSQGFSIDYVVKIPADQELELQNEFGEIILPDYTGALDLTSKFGGVDAGDLGNVRDLLVEFGKFKADAMHGSHGAIKFSSAKVRSMSGENDLDIEFCGEVEFELSSDIKEIDFDAANSTIELMLPNNLSATFDIKTSFGSFDNNTNYEIEDEDDGESWGPDFDDHYRGRSASGTIPIYIDSSFSKIRFRN